MKEHKKRFRIEFTVNVRNEGFSREDWDWSDEDIKHLALQELTCMSPFPEDITFSEVEDNCHTETQTHGRCIDADALKTYLDNTIKEATEIGLPVTSEYLMGLIDDAIKNAPTVLDEKKK